MSVNFHISIIRSFATELHALLSLNIVAQVHRRLETELKYSNHLVPKAWSVIIDLGIDWIKGKFS